MSPFERDEIKQRIHRLRLEVAHAPNLLNNYLGDEYTAELQKIAAGRGITVDEAAKLVNNLLIEQREAEINMLLVRLGELPSNADDFSNVVSLPTRKR